MFIPKSVEVQSFDVLKTTQSNSDLTLQRLRVSKRGLNSVAAKLELEFGERLIMRDRSSMGRIGFERVYVALNMSILYREPCQREKARKKEGEALTRMLST